MCKTASMKKKKTKTAGNINDVCKWNSLRHKDLFRMSFARVFSFWLTFVLNSTCCQRWSYLYLARQRGPVFVRTKQNDTIDKGKKKEKTIRKEINVLLFAWHRMQREWTQKRNRRNGRAWVAGGIVRNISSWWVCIQCVLSMDGNLQFHERNSNDNRMGVVALSSLILFGIISFMPFLVRCFLHLGLAHCTPQIPNYFM